MDALRILVGVVLATALVMGAAFLGSSMRPSQPETDWFEEIQAEAAERKRIASMTPAERSQHYEQQTVARIGSNLDSLDRMELAFEGNYSRSAIKERVDQMMLMYDVSLTEENYNKVGSVLVTLRKEGEGYTEMEILAGMVANDFAQFNVKWHEAAALVATELGVQRR